MIPNIKELGFFGKVTDMISLSDLEGFELGRVIIEHKDRYVVQTGQGTFSAQITGNLRYSAESQADFPAVGDWVKLTMMDEDTAIIVSVLPRTSRLERKAVGKPTDVQLIATNIDVAFIVQSVGHDFNLKRIERYLTVCYASNIEPVIILTKTDLAEKEELQELLESVQKRIKDVWIFSISNLTLNGFDLFKQVLEPFKTYCFLGSSGVGKSTIVNHLKGEDILKTNIISSSTNKGKHTTTHRELIVLPNKSIVIDTPGMREIGMVDNAEGIEQTYDEIEELAQHCKFNDCSHINETGCAVLEAIRQGTLSEDVYNNYLKLKREQAHFSSTIAEKRRKEKKQAKLYRSILTEHRKNKY